MSNKRNRTPPGYIDYGVYLYFLGLSLRNVVKALSYLNIVKRSHVTIWNWIQKFHPKKVSLEERKEVSEYIVDETVIKAGSENIWLWGATEPENGQFLALFLPKVSKERNMFVVAERFLSDIVKNYGKHAVFTDGGTWYPQTCEFLKIQHHIHSLFAK